jgi:hypothetical protein
MGSFKGLSTRSFRAILLGVEQPAARPDDIVRLPVAEVVAELSSTITTTVVALLSGAPNTKTVRLWASGRIPTPDRERVLRFSLQLVRLLRRREDPATVQNWITTYNHTLEDTPALLLRDHPLDEVSKRIMVAARAFMGATE